MSELTQASIADRHRAVAATFTDVLSHVTDWDAPTPVKEWNTAQLVDHVTVGAAGFLRSQVGLELDDDVHDGDPHLRWAGQAAQVQAFLESPAAAEVADTAFGRMPAGAFVDGFYTSDLFMHTWDLAKASGQPVALDEDYAQQIHGGYAGMPEEALRDPHVFGAAVPVDPSANPVDQLIGFIGRDPNWTPAD